MSVNAIHAEILLRTRCRRSWNAGCSNERTTTTCDAAIGFSIVDRFAGRANRVLESSRQRILDKPSLDWNAARPKPVRAKPQACLDTGSDEPGEQLVREQAAARRQDDPVVVVTSRSSAASAQPNASSSGGVRGRRERDATVGAQAEDDRLRGRGRGIDRLRAARREAGHSPIGRGECGEVAVEAGRVPAPRDAVEGVRARPDRLVRPALPVDEVVPALVPGPRPVADLVAAPAVLGEAVDGVVVLGRGAILVLGRARGRRASDARRRWSAGGRRRGRSALRHPGRRGSGRRARGGRARGRAPPRASSIQSTRVASGASYSRSRLTEAMPPSRASATVLTTSTTRWRRPSRRSPAADIAWAPIESRVTPAARSAAASPRSSGPGFASSVTSASGGDPVARGRRARAARRCRPRAAATASHRRDRRSPAPADHVPNAASSASARRSSSARSASTNAPTRAFGPRAAAPA